MLYAQERWSSRGVSCWCIIDSSTLSVYPFGRESYLRDLLNICENGTDSISEYNTDKDNVYSFTYNPTYNPMLQKQDDTTPLRLEELRKLGEHQKYKEEFNRRLCCWHGINSDIDMSDFYPKSEPECETVAAPSQYGWTINYHNSQTGQEVPSDNPHRYGNVDEGELLLRQVRESPYGGRRHVSSRCTKCGHTYISSELRYRCDECGGQAIHNTACDG